MNPPERCEETIAGVRADKEEIPVNSAKYEGEMTKSPEGDLCEHACSAKESSDLIDESSAIVFFLRKSFLELSTSY
jgi:hypothetical protein